MAETQAKFEGLLQRVRSALILLPFVIAPVIFGGWSFTLLLAITGFLMAREWAICSPHRHNKAWRLALWWC